MQAAVRRFGLFAATAMLPFVFCAVTSSTPLDQVLKRLESNAAVPAEYTANVQVKMHMRGFPWITKTVSGTELYKHPGLYHFAFRDAPKSLDQLSSLEDDLANPAGWPQRYDVSLITPPSPTVEPVVELMPKVHKLVKSIDITVNMAKAHIDKAVWTRFDGGTITMTQKFNIVDSREVVSEQDATVRIPMMSADVTATYSNFEVDSGSGAH